MSCSNKTHTFNLASVVQNKEKQEPLRLFLNTAKADTLWRFLDILLSVLPGLNSITCLMMTLIVLLVFKLPVEQVLGGRNVPMPHRLKHAFRAKGAATVYQEVSMAATAFRGMKAVYMSASYADDDRWILFTERQRAKT
jgi:hypothetical protein